MKQILIFIAFSFVCAIASSQTCYTLGPRNNGNGQSGSCGTPNCSGDDKTGHFNVVFSTLPSPLPTMQLIAVSPPPVPSPFCFDPGALVSGTTVRYCFRGTNLPSSGSMTIRFTQGSTVWNCTYNVDGSGGNLLPVKLTGFDAKLNSGSVMVRWNTESEQDNEKFNIERGDENQYFQTIGSVAGRGNSVTTQQYSFSDPSPLKGISYYRLKQVDTDGKYSYSPVKRVDNRLSGLHIDRIFPNPSASELNVQVSADEPAELNAALYNMAGKRVLAANKRMPAGSQNWHFDLHDLSKGIYQLVVKNQKGEQLSEKVLIN